MAKLRRSLSLIDVVALGINGVIGTGIFLLPGAAAANMGPASLVTMVFAAFLSFVIALCFAEVGSHFTGTGGAYLYALRVHGDGVGFFVGWINCGVTFVAWAALINGLNSAAAYFAPVLGSGWPRAAFILGVMLALTLINLRGAKIGALVANLFTAAKLIPLTVFVAVGLFFIDGGQFKPFAPHGYGDLFESTLLIFYAFVGFESMVVPAGEMKNPQRMVPLSLIIVLSIVALLYVGVQVVSIGTLPTLAGHENPVAAASQNFLGSAGGLLIAAGILVSMLGVNAASALVGPRRLFALAEHGHLPKKLSELNIRGVPALSIWIVFAMSAGLALWGSFKELALISIVGRTVQYISTCAAALVLRHRAKGKAEPRDGFALPMGPVIPIIAISLCALLLAKTAPNRLIAGAIAVSTGIPVYAYILYRRRS